MKENIFKYSRVAAWLVAGLFVIGLVVRLLLPASSFKGFMVDATNIGVAIAMLVFFIILNSSIGKSSPIRISAILGIVGYGLLTLVMLFDISGIFGTWLKVIYCVLLIIALVRMCKFFPKGSRVKVSTIILIVLFALLPIVLLLSGLLQSIAAESIVQYGLVNGGLAPQTERVLGVMLVFVLAGIYLQLAHNLVAAWFLFEFSHLNKQ